MGQTQFRSDDTVKWWLGFGNGSDGDYSSVGNATDAPVDSSCSGNAASTSLSATNASFAANKPVLIIQMRGTGAGNWELNQIASYVAGTITLKKPLQNTYTDSGNSQAQVIQLKQYNNFTQNSGHTLTAKAWDGNVGGIIAFLAKGTVTITGNLISTGKGFIGGSGTVGASADYAGKQGEGTSGAGTNAQPANGNGAGGGAVSGGGTKAGGGGGGNGAAGSAGQTTSFAGGAAGAAAGNAGLTSMVMGGGGGQGAYWGGNGGGDAGEGGGIIFIIAKDISISGTIVTSGTNGAVGASGRGGSGGGAGGSVLVKAMTATLGTTKITAAAGSGGTGVESNGGNGAVGRIHLDYKTSYSGSTTPTIDARQDSSIQPFGGNQFFNFFFS